MGQPLQSLPFDGYDEATVQEHLRLMIEDAGLLTGECIRGIGGILLCIPGELTWKGHDFLKAAEDDSVWRSARSRVLKAGTSFTFDVLLEWLKAEARSKLGLP